MSLFLSSLPALAAQPFDVLLHRLLNQEGHGSFVGVGEGFEFRQQRGREAGSYGDLLFGRGYGLPGHGRKCIDSGNHVNPKNINNLVDMVNLFPVTCQLTNADRPVRSRAGGFNRETTMSQLTFDRVLLWNPVTKETRVVLHVFDAANPTVLIHRTTSAAEAERMTGLKYDTGELRPASRKGAMA